MKGGFVLYNGRFFKEDELLFSASDAATIEIGIKEIFRTVNNEILFANHVYENILQACAATSIPVPEDFDITGNRLKKDVSRLLNKNKYYLAAEVMVRLFPGEKSTGCLIISRELNRGYYPLNTSGLLLGFYNSNKKNLSKLSRFEIGSRYLWVLAGSEATAKNKQNMILFDNRDCACECIGSSFAYIKEREIIFPDPGFGGYQSVLVEPVKECAVNRGLSVRVSESITDEDILDADEIFVIDNSLGILKVLGLESRRYYSIVTEEIASELGIMAANSIG